MNGDGVPILGRDLRVRLPRYLNDVLGSFAAQQGVTPAQAASMILQRELTNMATAYAVEVALRMTGIYRPEVGP